jgi:RNA polymerase sigma-70 factor (ECF subfamily)
MIDLQTNGTWKSWFNAYGARLLLYARQWTRCPADAEDLVQEAFVRFWKSRARVEVEPEIALFLSVRRAGLDHLRKNHRRNAREERFQVGEDTTMPAFQADLESRERCIEVQRALESLTRDQREVVVLKIWGELTFEQVAATLGIPANTAASRYRYALSALRKNLRPDVHA